MGEAVGVDYRFSAAVDVPDVWADVGRIEQVVANLLSNATKFSPKGTTVDVRVSVVGEERVRVEVSDEGPGLPPAIIDRVFERFVQGDSGDTRSSGGTGLGLTIARSIVERHGGEVPADMGSLEALPGVGHKTASVVMIQAFEVPAFPVDTHIHRLAARWGLSTGKNVEKTEADLKQVFPIETWIRLHLQIIYFGREHCPARGHDLSLCPICSWAATAKRIAEEARR